MAGHNVPAIFVFAHFVIPGSLAMLAPRNDRIGFQTAKRHRPYSLRRRVRRSSAFALAGFGGQALAPRHETEGVARRPAQPSLCARTVSDARRLSARHWRLFCPRDRSFRARTGGLRPPRSGRLSPAFVCAAFSPCGQPHVVGADGYPRPPGGGVTSPARRRRIPSRCQNVSLQRPRKERMDRIIV